MRGAAFGPLPASLSRRAAATAGARRHYRVRRGDATAPGRARAPGGRPRRDPPAERPARPVRPPLAARDRPGRRHRLAARAPAPACRRSRRASSTPRRAAASGSAPSPTTRGSGCSASRRATSPSCRRCVAGYHATYAVYDHERDAWSIEGPPGAAHDALAAAAAAEPPPPAGRRAAGPAHGAQPASTRAGHAAACREVQRLIALGEAFEVNLAHVLETSWDAGGWALFERLLEAGPGDHAAFLALGGVELASVSPEVFLRIEDGVVETRPIKGTRPRGATAGGGRGARRRARRVGQGPRRERDDRRPAAQRPDGDGGARERAGRRACARSSARRA